MGYYGPGFANLGSGWYFTTSNPNYADERDRCLVWWDAGCDEVVASYLHRFGMFVSAFEPQIRDEIKARLERRVEFPRYFSYFFMSRILASSELTEFYAADYTDRATRSIECCVCSTQQTYDDIHPSLIGRTRRVLPLCNSCWFWLAEFTRLDDLAYVSADLKDLIRRLSIDQVCPICSKQFKWLDRKVRYTFEVPFLPSRHIEICPKCVKKAVLGGPDADDAPIHLKHFKQVADVIGAIPNQHGFVYDQTDSLEKAVHVTKIMQRLPSFDKLAKVHGSWFKLLIASGVLPSGTRRTHYGTMVLARDGHECLSLAEKTIDDLLHEHSIPHEKEPRYPGAEYRADWKVSVGGLDVFIELFGLDGQASYSERMRQKMDYAKQVGMTVIPLDRKDLKDLRRAFLEKVLPRLSSSTLGIEGSER